MQAPDELRALVEESLAALQLDESLGGLEEPIRYALGGGGKRIRPVLCLAVCEAAGGTLEDAVAPATALELVHTFSLVHDDLPALDDDDERRGRPSLHVAFGEAVALLAGDALLAEALGLAARCEPPELARELARATLGMIGGQYLDVTGAQMQLDELHRLKTGRLFAAAVGLGLWSAGLPAEHQGPWRAFGEETATPRSSARTARVEWPTRRRNAPTHGSRRSTPTPGSWASSSTGSRSGPRSR
jgi:geranylgeranyl diphosphate synthase type II